MTYKPAVNDYVKWGTDQGWVYYVDSMGEYFTIEVGVKDKPDCEYTKAQESSLLFDMSTIQVG